MQKTGVVSSKPPTADCGAPLRDDGECSVHSEAWLCRRVKQRRKKTGKPLPEEVTGAPNGGESNDTDCFCIPHKGNHTSCKAQPSVCDH
jgi:hypothetical protein